MSVSEVPGALPPIRCVGFLLIPGFALMTYASAIEPLRAANELSGKTLYRWWHATPGNTPAVASNGAAILPDFEFGSEPLDLDLMIICAGGNPAAFKDRKTFAWLRRIARTGVIMGGVSGGPVILARAGLLRGRRCTVHWEHLPALKEEFPEIRLARSLFEIDGDRITCSGGVAGLDLMVTLITRDHGYELGAAVGDWFLHSQIREGHRPQRMDLRFRLGVADKHLLRALTAMESQLESPLTREQIARIAGISLRQLERCFCNHLGRGMHQHYLALRLSHARQLLRQTSLSIRETSLATGFSSLTHFSRAFRRMFRSSPREIRRQDRLGRRPHVR